MARMERGFRIASLFTAAVRVFALKGFRRAQMAEIAREMGVSAGLLYNYVESKEALFYLIIDRAFVNPQPAEPLPFPVPTPAPGAIAARVIERFRAEAPVPLLLGALTRERAEDPAAELAGIVRELYGNIYRTAQIATIVERSSLDIPELSELFYGRIRGGTIARLARLIESRIAAGQFRLLPHPAVAARLILETITWFARNRRGDPATPDITNQAAEEATVDFIVNSLIARSSDQPPVTRRESPLTSPPQR